MDGRVVDSGETNNVVCFVFRKSSSQFEGVAESNVCAVNYHGSVCCARSSECCVSGQSYILELNVFVHVSFGRSSSKESWLWSCTWGDFQVSESNRRLELWQSVVWARNANETFYMVTSFELIIQIEVVNQSYTRLVLDVDITCTFHYSYYVEWIQHYSSTTSSCRSLCTCHGRESLESSCEFYILSNGELQWIVCRTIAPANEFVCWVRNCGKCSGFTLFILTSTCYFTHCRIVNVSCYCVLNSIWIFFYYISY